MRGTTVGRYLACTALVAGLVWAFGPAWRLGYPPAFPDSSSYLDVAATGPFSPDFWFASRPPTYPLFVWIVGISPRSIVLVQTLVAVLAWAWLLTTVRDRLRSPIVAAPTIVVLALVAIESRWAFWHTAVLTESLSASLAVAGIAAWWRWFDEPARFRLVVATLSTGAWMLLRDSNAITLAAVAVPALVVVTVLERRRTGPRRRGLSVALATLVAVAGFSAIGQLSTDRGETSFHNNVGKRWLLDAEMTDWMVDRGMPMSDALSARAGSDAWADGEAFLRSPFLADYRDWADGRGRAVAAASFVLRADWYLDRLWGDLPAYTGTDHLAYDTFEVARRLPERPLGALDPAGSRPALVVWGLAVAASAVVVARRRPRGRWLVPFWFVPVLSDLYLSYVADAVEVGRHLVGPLMRFAVVAVVSVALAVDALLQPDRPRVAPTPAGTVEVPVVVEAVDVEAVDVEAVDVEAVEAEAVDVDR